MGGSSGRPSCINCYSPDAEMVKEDGEWIKRCPDCGYVWGPFTHGATSRSGKQTTEMPEQERQATLATF